MDQHTEARGRKRASAPASGPLSGIRVIDLGRLAPAPYCTMLLADMGAQVVVVGGGAGSRPIAALARGKQFIDLDLKSSEGREAFYRLVGSADVLVEGYRPGVTKRLGIDYETLSRLNERLVYCSVTGYGQSGAQALEAGHDLNYLALSGALGAIGPQDDVPSFPLNLVADFAGGSLFAAMGIAMALYERTVSGRGQYIDAAMVDGCLSLMAMHFQDWGNPVLPARGDGLLAGSAPFYRCYRCADGRFIAVAALEQRFFQNLWSGLGYVEPVPNHMDRATWQTLRERFSRTFNERPRDAWAKTFEGLDACVSPVLDPAEAVSHPHNRERHPDLTRDNVPVAPALARTPGHARALDVTDRTVEVLSSLGYASENARDIAAAGRSAGVAALAWPPA